MFLKILGLITYIVAIIVTWYYSPLLLAISTTILYTVTYMYLIYDDIKNN